MEKIRSTRNRSASQRCGNAKGGHGYTFQDAFVVGYVFPRMSVTNTTGNVIEEVRIKPTRCELK